MGELDKLSHLTVEIDGQMKKCKSSHSKIETQVNLSLLIDTNRISDTIGF